MRNEFVMSGKVTVKDRNGLRMLTAQRIALMANQNKSTLTISHKHHRANATNLLDILILAAMCGTDLDLQACGEDAELALVSIARLINSKAKLEIAEPRPILKTPHQQAECYPSKN